MSILRSISLLLAFALSIAAPVAQTVEPSVYAGLRYRLLGPFRGGRALAVCGVPGDLEHFYFGSVGGGVWESRNAGRTWNPIFNGPDVASIGAIAVAQSDPNVIYVGSGEADMRSDVQQGDGMYRSADAGKSWTHIGLEDTRQIGKILVDPKNADIVYVAALGHQYGPNDQRGVFKTTDAGKTWIRILSRGPDVGAIDMDMDARDSNVIFAALWSTRRPPWSVYSPSNGPGGGLFKTTDAGKTWTQIQGRGFPDKTGRIGVAISPADSNRVYAIVDTNDPTTGGVYRSDDAGATWTKSDGESRIWGRGWYFGGITADPRDPDLVYVMNTSTYRSTDGAKTFTPIKGAPGGDDYHALWIQPDAPDHMVLGSDQGVVVSVDGAKTWSSWYNQPTAQLYHVVTDNRFPYWVYGAQQDSGAIALPSRTIHSGVGALYERPIDAGGESGTIAPDPLHPGLLFSSTGTKEQIETGWQQRVDPTTGRTDTRWRHDWTQPIVDSPADPRVFYTSRQKIFRTSDGGATWQVISPDLSRESNPDPTNLNPATIADNEGGTRRGVVYWLAPSPIKPKLLWAGTDDGLIWLTRDDGAHWQNVTPPNLTSWSKVGIIDASHFHAETAYAAVDRHRLDDNHPYIYRTHDGGKTWQQITNGLPDNKFVNVVREDPQKPGLLYAGTDWGMFVSFDDGNRWQSLQLNLPVASVRDIAFGGNDVVVGTHGRSVWILDDPTVLRQATALIQGARLFKPSPTCIFQRAGTFGFGAFDEGTPLPPEEPQGENPPWGAILDYYLPTSVDSLTLTVTDSSGKQVRRISSADPQPRVNRRQMDIPAYWIRPPQTLSAASGGHRYVWDLRSRNAGGPVVPPGKYTVTLTVNRQTISQPLSLTRDPRVPVSDAALRSQFRLATEIQDEISAVDAAEAQARELMRHKLSISQATRLLELVGRTASEGNPDDSGEVPNEATGLRALSRDLTGLLRQVESGPSAPTPEDLAAFDKIKLRATEPLLAIDRMAHGKFL